MVDSRTGNVNCDRCRAYLGNYQSGDYFKLIRTKYCPECRAEVNRENKRFWAVENRKAKKQYQRKMKERIELLEAENELLRERIRKDREG